MRRFDRPVVLLALTTTLVAQTPTTIPLTQPDKFHCKLTYDADMTPEGTKIRVKHPKLEFEIGITITADEAVFDRAHDGVFQLSGHVQMTLKK
jgi:hypothetical protein